MQPIPTEPCVKEVIVLPQERRLFKVIESIVLRPLPLMCLSRQLDAFTNDQKLKAGRALEAVEP